ncbi:COG4223 family protein [Methylocapsa palsarum]|uniref:Uncharacterized conserved protein n=1 Tax=Methylocapsa palsarum TaxID=1612308 RepID=A0A1I3WFR5_9HYPH|nr:hypothetical protein [Methylocapsa palsarum]SFK05647.1 Uncharacterized conserved protein [Methylocapsa palsarum]
MSKQKDEHSTSGVERAPPDASNESGAETAAAGTAAEASTESAAPSAAQPPGQPDPSHSADLRTDAKTGGSGAHRPKSPWLPLAAAIVTGSLIAVGGAFGLRYLDAVKPAGAATDFDARAAAIEQKVNEAGSASRIAFAALESRISSLASETGKSEASTRSALENLEQALAARPAQASQGSGAEASEPADLGPIRMRLDAIEKAVAALPAEAPPGGGGAAEQPNFAPLEKRLDAIEQKVGALEAQLAAPKANVRAQEPRENAPRESVKAEPQGHSVAVVAGSLLGKVQRGAPFAADLSALETLGVGAGALAPLRPHAATGVASERTLTEQFSPLVSPILASEPPREHESFIDELTRSASKLVHIHRDDVAGGDDLQGLVDKIESALAQRDIEDAYALWTKFPDAAKAKSQGWGEAARARIDALAAARAIQDDAVTLVVKPKS